MPVAYKDYYAILGVDRKASDAEIRKAFRRLAKEWHPDVNKKAGADERYREINEAYEVLKDPEKRAKYDALGSEWQNGADFSPPPGWGGFYRGGGDPWQNVEFHFSSSGEHSPFGDFSDFFRAVFGGEPFSSGKADRFSASGRSRHRFDASSGDGAGFFEERREERTDNGTVELTLEEAAKGCTKNFFVETASGGRRSLEVRIPPGVTEGSRVRITGQGDPRSGGDLFLRVRLLPHRHFSVDGHDLTTTVNISPWEAALGSDVLVPTLNGSVRVKIPAGSSSGRRLRLRGKGLPKRRGEPGDLFAVLRIVVPKSLSAKERDLFERLARESSFDPRGERG
jgi:curved DNA-binding protein